MATIESREIIEEMLLNDGHYGGDPPPYSIWRYRNVTSNKWTHAVFYQDEHDMHNSPYVADPELLWALREGLTESGRRFLRG